ncbi:MAG: NuoI/complex I 23 kDa subunit family protein, partial [Elusimicrobiales bacterium]
MIKVKNIKVRELNFLEKVYIIEIFKGFEVTLRHFLKNLFRHLTRSKILTIRYPEEKISVVGNARYKSKHRIKLRYDGSPKCVACMMCATICPARCIEIEADETDLEVEKYPKKFNIDLSRCVMCGLCVEACPEDAISMDSGEFEGGRYHRFAPASRGGLFYTKNELFKNLDNDHVSEKGAS